MHDEDAKKDEPKKEEGKEEESVEKVESKVVVKPKFDPLDLETPMNIMIDEKLSDEFQIKQLPYDELLNVLKLNEEEQKLAQTFKDTKEL